MLLGTFDVNFVEQREGHVVFAGAKFLDLFVRARFLRAEIVAGHADDSEAAVFVFLMNGFEGFVLGSVAAFGSDVDEKDRFAGEGAEVRWLAVDVFERDFVNGSHVFSDDGGRKYERCDE